MARLAEVHSEDHLLVVTGVAVLVAGLGLVVVLDGRAPDGVGSAALIAAGLFLASLPILAGVGRRDGDRSLFPFLCIALAVKLAGGFARYYLTSAAYGGLADASRYDHAGREWVAALKAGSLVGSVEATQNLGAGTKVMGTITGVVYSLFGRNILTGFVVFSWLGFWGLTLAYRALRVGAPEVDHHRYRLLLFFLPSLVFWPSSIGKDAWMQLTLGLVVLGAAQLTRVTPQLTGIAWLAAGLTGAALVRPQIALAALAPLLVALAIKVKRTVNDRSPPVRSGAVRLIGLGLLGLGGLLVLNRLGTVFGGDTGDSTAGSVSGVLNRASTITAQGGSEFQATSATSITDLPMATISVLYRPFLWEVDSFVKAIAGLETALLLGLTVVSWRRLRNLPSRLRANRYLLFLTAFTLVSIVGFSRVGNEGILARQRTQFLPAFVALLCLRSTTGRLDDVADEEGPDEEARPGFDEDQPGGGSRGAPVS